MSDRLPRASTLEGVRFTAQVLAPHMIQGFFRRRPRAAALATKLDVDRRAVSLVAGLRRRHGPGPLWIRAGGDHALLLFATEDVRRVLEGSPHPFAADPPVKRQGMSNFQPDAVTITRRRDLWENRRRFNEAVLDTGKPLHRLAERMRTVAGEETAALLDRAGDRLEWPSFYAALRRITRRVVLGDGAGEDDELSDLLAKLMDDANRRPKDRSPEFEPFTRRLREYVAAAEPGSLVSLFAEAPSDGETNPEGQVPHWLFAMWDTLAANAFRALAVLCTHSDHRARVEDEIAAAAGEHGAGTPAAVAALDQLEAALQDTMRLWPTTPLLSRETVEETRWDDEVVPAGTQVLIHNLFNHRDPERHEFADRFAPEAWPDGGAGDDWCFNHFSHGPQGCPGTGLALFVGKAVLADLLSARRLTLLDPRLDRGRPLPHMLDFFALRFRVEPRDQA